MQTERVVGAVQAWVALVVGAGAAAATEAPALRFHAAVTVLQPAPFVQLPLPVSAYAHSRAPGLADLRVLDAADQKVPFALLSPRDDATQTREQTRPVTMYPLPKRHVGDALPASLEVVIQGDRISLRQRAAKGGSGGASGVGSASAGWLFDLGERKPQQPAAISLRLHWTAPAEFSSAYTMDWSDDLRHWRRGPDGQLMALSSPTGALTQPLVMLGSGAGRFVRLAWINPAQAPLLNGADAITEHSEQVQRDPPTELSLVAGPAPAGPGPAEPRALQVDLGAPLPLYQLDFEFPAGTRVIPLRVQQRSRADQPWRELVQGVIYRIERDGQVSRSPPLALHARARYLRLLPDERAPAIDAASTSVRVQVRLARLVFPTQGTPPYRVATGATDAAQGALPIETLVPQLEDERARFGRAELGPWVESSEVARQVARQEAIAAARPWLLWAVLLGGVAALTLMVWRLALGRSSPR